MKEHEDAYVAIVVKVYA